jgi:hypothetical protein
VAKAIVNNFTIESVCEEFKNKAPQRQGIKCSVKEILGLPYPLMQVCSNFLRDLLTVLQENFENLEASKNSQPAAGSEETPPREGEDQFESMDFPRTSAEEGEYA